MAGVPAMLILPKACVWGGLLLLLMPFLLLSLHSLAIAEASRKLHINHLKLPARTLLQTAPSFHNPNLHQQAAFHPTFNPPARLPNPNYLNHRPQQGALDPNFDEQGGGINPNLYEDGPFVDDEASNNYNLGEKNRSPLDGMGTSFHPKFGKQAGEASSTNDYRVDGGQVPAFSYKVPSSLDETRFYDAKHQSSSSNQQGLYYTPSSKKSFYFTPTYEERVDDSTSKEQTSIPNLYNPNYPSHKSSIHSSPLKGSSINDELHSPQLVSNYDSFFNAPTITHGSSTLHASITPSFAHPSFSQHLRDHDLTYGRVQVP